MSNREKILVLVSFAAAIYGVIVLVDKLDKATRPVSPVEDMAAFVGQVSATVNEDPSQGLNDSLLAKARGDWGDDPFYPDGPVSFDAGEKLHYQGYVKTGRRVFALINNNEYRVGEDIEGGGLIVRAIMSDRVILVTPERKKRILPIQGD